MNGTVFGQFPFYDTKRSSHEIRNSKPSFVETRNNYCNLHTCRGSEFLSFGKGSKKCLNLNVLCWCHLHFVNDESNFDKALKNNPFFCHRGYHHPLIAKIFLHLNLPLWKSQILTCVAYWNTIIDARSIISHQKRPA